MPASLTLMDFSDRDLLHALADCCDGDGWATAEIVARQIGIDHPRPAQCVGARFSWLMRYGLMENQREGKEIFWRATPSCLTLVFNGKITDAQRKSFEKLPESKRVDALDALARLVPTGTRQSAHLARRAYQHRMGAWRDPLIYKKKDD